MVRFPSILRRPFRVLLLVLWVLPVFGQLQERWIFRSFAAEGRSIPTVNCMAQDGDGMLWLGTDGGLIRYDGNRFRFYGVSDGLPPMAVSTLAMHPKGGLWAGTSQGLLRIQGDRFRFVSLQSHELLGLSVTFFGVDGEGGAWIPLSDGVYRTKDDLLQRDEQTRSWRYPSYLFQSRTLGGLASLDGEQRLRVRGADGTWQVLWQARELADAPLWYVTEDASGTLWASSYTRLVSLTPGERVFRDRTALVRGTLQQFPSAPDPDGCLTILTTSGLLRVKGNAPPFWMPRQEGWPTGSLFASLVDRDRALWLGGTGLFRRMGEGIFQCFELGGREGKETFRSMWGDATRKGLWVGTSRGLGWWDGIRFQLRPEFRGLEVLQLRLGKDGTLWVATADRRIWRLDPGDQRARPIPFRLPPEYQGLAAGDQGVLYVSLGMQGVLEIRDGVARPLPTTGLTTRSNITFLAVDEEGRLWAAGGLGIQVWDGQRWHAFGTENGLPGDWVSAVHIQANGSLWVSYRNPVGLTHLRYGQGRFEVLGHYTTRNGLPSDVVYDLGTDALGRLWVGTGVGPALFDGWAFRVFSTEDGLPSEGCSSGAMTQGPDGYFWFANGDTLVRVLPSRFTTNVAPPVARLTRVAGPDQEWLLTYRQPPPIAQRAASLEFDFCAGALGTEQGVRFQVRMLGLDDTWRDSEERRASYFSLPAGKFTFQVRAATLNGAWGPVASVPLVIVPRWYATWWAKGFWTLVGILGVFLVVWLQKRRWLRQRVRLERLVAMRTEDIVRAKQAIEEANEALRAQSLTDPLTGLRNRRYLELVVEEDVQRHLRMRQDGAVPPPSGGDLVFILVDLDHFKRVNDTHGHDAGDLVLRETAEVLQLCVRERDAVVRWGGEEFLILLRETDREKSVEVAERIRVSLVEHRFQVAEGVVLRLSCSIGFAALPLVPERLDWLSWKRTVKLADRCLYAVKAGGRDGWLGALRARVEDPAAHAGLLDGDPRDLTREGVLACAASRPELELRAAP